MKEKEHILCAATWFDSSKEHSHQPKNITTGMVMCGHRHNSIFGQFGMSVKERQENGIYEVEQGFLTNTNRFVDRTEAAKIAFAAGQIREEKSKLYSEDLY